MKESNVEGQTLLWGEGKKDKKKKVEGEETEHKVKIRSQGNAI